MHTDDDHESLVVADPVQQSIRVASEKVQSERRGNESNKSSTKNSGLVSSGRLQAVTSNAPTAGVMSSAAGLINVGSVNPVAGGSTLGSRKHNE